MQKLKMSTKDKSIHGVCGGIAGSLGVSSLIVRIFFICTAPVSFIVYIILANTLEDR